MIAVIGAGAFGTALAVSLARNGPVALWARDAEQVREIHASGQNARRLPGVDLPENITVSADIETVLQAEIVLLSVPAQKLRRFLETCGETLAGKHVVACCKGMERGTGLRPTQIVAEHVPDAIPATLTGPSFAHDIARGLPTALTLACADESAGERLQTRLTTPNIRLYRTTDVIGAELGGALKNVIAIACGVAIGAGLGESARAALMTRGFAELVKVAEKYGAKAETLAGLSGFGDLVLTCTSEQSRNYRFGQSIGAGDVFDSGVTVEGAATAQALAEMAQETGLDLPITRVVTGLVGGELNVRDAVDMLLQRPLKEE
ncbi:NAD(P)H-dependent glycerol-3-phosphate dehydrogenase [Roseovarius atlanticus]|uniref:NAD(P)H-dependent glycerol-3-phosphate dehydrogenase n=1 Tax=Roseovarius atlanticus TaxID=1641875 RepID=UPI001C95E359|nr:NAD(P)H-dependent glycerol-3-phosphate dehydrogenase [Roseovarius atlanticus]MBY5987072.1 NAD(P)-dependent glycerol-3-phosphate dehydrogenase [Roseovarius atlanticus]MBY6125712.1 NAD(P)-dependent glycerol-3-phosphate dehydrogenase [Roseovarius atlanticus]MBY6149827.1 NAD(P)-dependent glycerol-3-phosphate dehydrogenase [Roseovarius atlanticus]